MTFEAVKQAAFIVCPVCDEKKCVGRYKCQQIADYIKNNEEKDGTA